MVCFDIYRSVEYYGIGLDVRKEKEEYIWFLVQSLLLLLFEIETNILLNGKRQNKPRLAVIK